eukprot:gb/GECG01001573.1/.p1 GENE.gb/GECG01001573.1/~~gb/GECG01001573.1/.p1  ORF type:complete len:134 (+),score=28.80 gb/GECG01001573.1/:1-402(+)
MHADNGNTELSIWIVPSIVRREREGLTGIARKEEVVHQTMGEDVDIFDRDATAFEEEGTKDNPIVILSNERSRIVGISLPDDAFCRYFVLEEGKIMHDPVTNNYLVLRKVDDAAVDQQIESVDKELGEPKAGE